MNNRLRHERSDEPSLCRSCINSTIIRGDGLRERVECSMISRPGQVFVQRPVRSCTSYQKKGTPTIREMEDVAWILRTDATRKVIGFVRFRSMKDGDPEKYHVPDDNR